MPPTKAYRQTDLVKKELSESPKETFSDSELAKLGIFRAGQLDLGDGGKHGPSGYFFRPLPDDERIRRAVKERDIEGPSWAPICRRNHFRVTCAWHMARWFYHQESNLWLQEGENAIPFEDPQWASFGYVIIWNPSSLRCQPSPQPRILLPLRD